MAGHLVVIVGAGASYDCAVTRDRPGFRNPNDTWRPPLTPQLFEPRHSFGQILDMYPGAQSAAAEIRVLLDLPRTEDEDAFALESYLREELKNSDNEDRRYRFRQIPLYLQHLLFEVSRSYTEPENYARLVNAALGTGLGNVVFITLNYDVILDRELFHRTTAGALTGEPEDPLDYVSDARTWVLIKLHGSVNWGRRIYETVPPDTPDGGVYTGWFEVLAGVIEAGKMDPEIELRPMTQIRHLRREDDNDDLYYPALSVPIGPDPKLENCPSTHVSALRRRLKAMGEEMNVLVVGYSGLDDEVLDLIAKEGKVRTLSIIDPNAEKVHSRFAKKLGPVAFENLGTSFGAWAQSADLDTYFQRLTTTP